MPCVVSFVLSKSCIQCLVLCDMCVTPFSFPENTLSVFGICFPTEMNDIEYSVLCMRMLLWTSSKEDAKMILNVMS